MAINCLLEAAGDKDEVVRETVSKSLRRLAKKYAVHVLQNAVVFRQKNPKVSFQRNLKIKVRIFVTVFKFRTTDTKLIGKS